MANNNQQLVFQITGNSSGLTQALAGAGNQINTFCNNAGGMFGQLSGGLGQITQIAGGLGGGIAGLAGPLGMAAAAVGGLVASTRSYVNELNELSIASGMSVESLQKWGNALQGTGENLEKIADINRDFADHLGDAFRDGSGPAGDLEHYGIKLTELQPLLSAADGGLRGIAKVYFSMRDRGANKAEITNMMETLASDSSKLIPILQKAGSESQFLQDVQNQSVQVTNDQAQVYKALDEKLVVAGNTMKWLGVEICTPLIEIFNTLVQICKDAGVTIGQLSTYISDKGQQLNDFINSFFNFKPGTTVFDFLENKTINFINTFIEYINKIPGVKIEAISTKDLEKFGNDMGKAAIGGLAPITGMSSYLESAFKRGNATTTADVNHDMKWGKGLSNSDWGASKKAEAAKKAAEAAAAKVKAIQDRAILQRQLAEAQLQRVISQMDDNGAKLQLKSFNRQQLEIEKTIRNTAKTLGFTEQKTTSLLKSQYRNRTRLFKEMVNQMIRESDPKKLRDNLAAIGTGLSANQRKHLGMNLREQIGADYTDHGFYFGKDQDKQNQLDENRDDLNGANNEAYKQKLISFEEFQKNKQMIQEKYETDSLKLSQDALSKTTTMWGTSFDGLGTMLQGAFGKSNAAAKVAFGVSKGIAVANSIVAIQQGIAKAISLGFPANVPVIASTIAQGASIVNTIQGTQIKGQAHDGWDSLPSTGTYNLQKGERVVGSALNQDLTRYLKSNNSNKSGDIKIEAPLIVNCQQIDDKTFNNLLQRHKNSVVQAVRESQKKNT
ncbi:hypothetical protein DCF38_10925 [Edwardsiella piscicida]|uniref:hypothetical protein n=1 Tax=Edwardsiella piscicida TaxID=1263550 RepID=UPI00105755D0|nr:hypothetical protein [Edwardsiella piscicida]UCQ40049.1 hypothetical protein DCF38_10925 [Edwardsiella piscicida]